MNGIYLPDSEILEIREEAQTLLGIIQKFVWEVQAELNLDSSELESLFTFMGDMGWGNKPNTMIELTNLLRKFAEARRLTDGPVNDREGKSDEGDQPRDSGT